MSFIIEFLCSFMLIAFGIFTVVVKKFYLKGGYTIEGLWAIGIGIVFLGGGIYLLYLSIVSMLEEKKIDKRNKQNK